MFTRLRNAYWRGDLEQSDPAPSGSFGHEPVEWTATLRPSLIHVGLVYFGATLRVNPLAAVEAGDPFTVDAVEVVVIDEPDTTRDQGEVDPLYELP